MKAYEMRVAIEEAEQTLRAADYVAQALAAGLRNRLQSGQVSHRDLEALKKELSRYNLHTRTWK